MKRTLQNSDAALSNKHHKMNENAPLDIGLIADDNCDKIKFNDAKNGLERIPLQRSSVSKKLVIKNFGIHSVLVII